jgi:endoglucanase
MNRSPLLTLLGLLLLTPGATAQNLDATAQLLEALTEAPGPSAFEEAVREIVVREYEALGASIEYDGLGSVLAILPGNTAGPRIMVTAHLDEVGLMVQHVTPDGFIRVKMLGGILEQALPDQRWIILGRNGPVTAVSGLRTIHVTPRLSAHAGVVPGRGVPRRRRGLPRGGGAHGDPAR